MTVSWRVCREIVGVPSRCQVSSLRAGTGTKGTKSRSHPEPIPQSLTFGAMPWLLDLGPDHTHILYDWSIGCLLIGSCKGEEVDIGHRFPRETRLLLGIISENQVALRPAFYLFRASSILKNISESGVWERAESVLYGIWSQLCDSFWLVRFLSLEFNKLESADR